MVSPDDAYHAGMRGLQDRFDTRRLADRLVDKLSRTEFTDEDRAFVESRTLFFVATADRDGRPDCSYKGGAAGFVRVTDVNELAFPSYDGNGMFRSLGNVLVNPAIALLFIDFEQPRRLAREWNQLYPARRSAARAICRRTVDRARACNTNFSELPALHPSNADGGSVGLRATRRLRSAGACVEAFRGIRRRVANGRSGACHITQGGRQMNQPHAVEHVEETAEWKNFSQPDEVREFPRGRVELINIGGATVGRAIFEPGWRWSTSVQPIAKTRSCDAPHFQYHVAGVLRVKMDDGTEFDCRPGDVSLLPSGHDAWVVGDEPAVVVDFQGMIDYAKSH